MDSARPPASSSAAHDRVGDLLVDSGASSRARVEDAARRAARSGRRIGEVLVDEGGLVEAELYRALAYQRGLRSAPVEALLERLDPTLARSLSRAFLDHHRMVPIRREGSVLLVATSDPAADADDLRRALEAAELELVLLGPTDFKRLWSAIDLDRPKAAPAQPAAVHDDLLAHSGPVTVDAHFIALFEAVLLDAIGERASDIHLEQLADRVRVRMRVDGELRDVARYSLRPADLRGVVNVVKIASGLDIAERRLPQGGRMRRRAGGHAYDLRVQTQPSLHGEHVVIRILPQDQRLLSIADLGMPRAVARDYRRLLDSPAGLVLVVGPTGSGKSTTLYAGLQILARDATRKVITVEDPIEYAIDGVQQTQVHPEIGFAFANAMRAFVRQDPDVILVGEIRDGETALEAIRASQTGHVVLSTLHCNDAVDAIQRLSDLGMHPTSIGSELLAVIAQRLAKRICTGCRVEVAEPNEAILAELFPAGTPSDFVCYEGRGCARCGGAGTHGRIAVIEYLRANAALRTGIAHRLAMDELREVAIGAGLVPMRESALDLVRAGVIPLSELPSLLPAERMAG